MTREIVLKHEFLEFMLEQLKERRFTSRSGSRQRRTCAAAAVGGKSLRRCGLRIGSSFLTARQSRSIPPLEIGVLPAVLIIG